MSQSVLWPIRAAAERMTRPTAGATKISEAAFEARVDVRESGEAERRVQ